MCIKINLQCCASKKWSKYKSHINSKKLVGVTSKCLEVLEISADSRSLELSVLLADDKEVQNYNKQFRNIDKPTNVLSFPSEPNAKETLSRHYTQSISKHPEECPSRSLAQVEKVPETEAQRLMHQEFERQRAHTQNFYLGDMAFGFTTIKMEVDQLIEIAQPKPNKLADIIFCEYMYYLFTHSLLHLLGYVHDRKKDREHMESLETTILKKLKIDAQYFR